VDVLWRVFGRVGSPLGGLCFLRGNRGVQRVPEGDARGHMRVSGVGLGGHGVSWEEIVRWSWLGRECPLDARSPFVGVRAFPGGKSFVRGTPSHCLTSRWEPGQAVPLVDLEVFEGLEAAFDFGDSSFCLFG
jgi:hypothetical protein